MNWHRKAESLVLSPTSLGELCFITQGSQPVKTSQVYLIKFSLTLNKSLDGLVTLSTANRSQILFTHPSAQVERHSPLCSCNPFTHSVQFIRDTHWVQVCKQRVQIPASMKYPLSHVLTHLLFWSSKLLEHVKQSFSVGPMHVSQVEWHEWQRPLSAYSARWFSWKKGRRRANILNEKLQRRTKVSYKTFTRLDAKQRFYRSGDAKLFLSHEGISQQLLFQYLITNVSVNRNVVFFSCPTYKGIMN